MNETQDFISAAVRDTEDFIQKTGMAESTFGMAAVGDATVVERLRHGRVTLRVVEKLLAYIRNNRIYPNRRQPVTGPQDAVK
jgi:hypothetical protein